MEFPLMIYARSSTANRIAFLIAGFLAFPCFANAQVVVTEIMYDLSEGSDSGREWIEVYNASTNPVTLTSLKVFENGTNHKITGDTAALSPGIFAVIADNPAKFKADWPNYTGLIFDSAFSLNNDGETIAITNGAGSTLDVVTYTNASAHGTGDSLQRASGSPQFDAGMPTPGVGIPTGGLVKSPAKENAQKSSGAVASVPTSGKVAGESENVSPATQIAAVSPVATSFSLWLAAPFLLAVSTSVGIIWSRHLKRTEWDIVEEIG